MSTNSQILIVEDEENLGTTLSEYLTMKKYTCKWANSAQDARNFFSSKSPAVVIMDIGLPDGNGLDLAKEFRSKKKDFVLLFLSALNDPQTRLAGLEIGADDYITKPFELRELTLRLERILQNHKSLTTDPESIPLGDLKIWFTRYEVQDGQGNVIPLSQKECAILKLLYTNKNQAVSRDHIIDKIWGENVFPSSRTVDNYIVKLRKWTETDSQNKTQILTIRGIGYKLILN